MESRSKVQVVESKDSPTSITSILVGVPEAGLVGLIACSYVVQKLALQEVGHVDSELTPQVMVIHESAPKYPIRVFGNRQLVVVLSEIPLARRLSYEFAKELENWAKAKGAEMVVGVTGIPSKQRMEAEEEAKLNVFGVSNSKEITDRLKKLGVTPLEEGMVAGTHATLLGRGMTLNLPNLTLLTESYPEFPDPLAAASSIEVLNSLLSIKLDTKPLIEESEEVRLKMRNLMRRTQQTMQQTEAPSVYA